MFWQKITLIGVGLLGGSLGLAVRQRGLARRVEGYVRRAASQAECEAAGIVDRATYDLAAAVQGADLVVFCTPLGAMAALAERLAPVLAPGAVVTDVGSVKATVVRDLEPIIARHEGHFVGSHPMAGGEKMGAGAARADLFENAVSVVTPTAGSDAGAVARLQQLWRAVGARVLTLPPERHDELVARSSHLVHVVSAALATEVLDARHPSELAALCANGFRDTTRVAAGSPEMWRDIVLANRPAIDQALEEYIRRLQTFQNFLRGEEAAAIESFFTAAKQRRDAWGEGRQSAG